MKLREVKAAMTGMKNAAATAHGGLDVAERRENPEGLVVGVTPNAQRPASFGETSSGWTRLAGVTEGERERRGQEKHAWNKGRTVSMFDENYKLAVPRSSRKPPSRNTKTNKQKTKN